MKKRIVIPLSLVASLLLCSTLVLAQTAGKNADQDKDKEHRSPFSKLAVWRHHKADAKSKNQKPASHPQVKAEQAPANHAQAKATPLRPTSSKQPIAKSEQKHPKQAAHQGKKAVKQPVASRHAPAGKPQLKRASLKQSADKRKVEKKHPQQKKQSAEQQ